MGETRTIKMDAQPSYINKEALIGTLLAFPIGTLVGAFMGKNRMEREKTEGKSVSSDPSIWNMDMVAGGLAGSVIGAVAAVGIAVATLGASVLTGGIGPLVAGTMGLALSGVSMGGMLLGGWLGGKHGQAVEKQQFADAVTQEQTQGVRQAAARGLEQGTGHGHGHMHAAAIEQERGMAEHHHR